MGDSTDTMGKHPRGIVRILEPRPEASSLYSWLGELPYEWQAVGEYDSDWLPPDDTLLLISHRHYTPRETSILRRTVERGDVPVLILADGIIEYRNTWCNPNLPPGTLFRPVLGHKLACLGEAQARAVRQWGNPGKVEVVGLPRLDGLRHKWSGTDRTASDSFRVLVATSRTPAFNDEQRSKVLKGLSDLRDFFGAHPKVNGRTVELVWRLTGGLEKELRIENRLESLEGGEIHAQIASVDAVVTTHSTTMLEAALLQKPVAVLDYQGQPNYVTPTWALTHSGRFEEVFRELESPPADKIAFQEQELRDQLQCQESATDRMVQLVTNMIEIGRDSKEAGQPLDFPPVLLPSSCESAEQSAEIQEQFLRVKEWWGQTHSASTTSSDLTLIHYDEAMRDLAKSREEANRLAHECEVQESRILRLEDRIEEQKVQNQDLHSKMGDVRSRLAEMRERNQKIRGNIKNHQEMVRQLRRRNQRLLEGNPAADQRSLRLESLLLSLQAEITRLEVRVEKEVGDK